MAEEESTQEETEGKEKKKSSLVLIIIIVVLILIILIGAVVAILMLGGEDEEQLQKQVEQANNQQQGAMAQPVQNMSTNLENTTPLSELGTMFPLSTFTVNLLSDSGRRYLKVQVNLEISGDELATELEQKDAVIRDIIIRILSAKSLEEISTTKGKRKLKEQIVSSLNSRIRDGKINNIYFTEFVVQ